MICSDLIFFKRLYCNEDSDIEGDIDVTESISSTEYPTSNDSDIEDGDIDNVLKANDDSDRGKVSTQNHESTPVRELQDSNKVVSPEEVMLELEVQRTFSFVAAVFISVPVISISAIIHDLMRIVSLYDL